MLLIGRTLNSTTGTLEGCDFCSEAKPVYGNALACACTLPYLPLWYGITCSHYLVGDTGDSPARNP